MDDDELLVVAALGLGALLLLRARSSSGPVPGAAPAPAPASGGALVRIVDRDGQEVATATYDLVAGNPVMAGVYACDKAGVSWCAKIDATFAEAQQLAAKYVPGASLVLAGASKVGSAVKSGAEYAYDHTIGKVVSWL